MAILLGYGFLRLFFPERHPRDDFTLWVFSHRPQTLRPNENPLIPPRP
jgi:hypothetical protein